MSKEANIRELALEVSGDLDEEVVQEKLAAAVILIKKNKETRDEFSSICHEIVDTYATEKNSERVLFLLINAILSEAKGIAAENEKPQPTEAMSIFCKNTCKLIIKGSLDLGGILIKRAIVFFKKTAGKEESLVYFITNCFMDTARLSPQKESNILFIPALILTKKVHRMTTKFQNQSSQSQREAEQLTFHRDFADLLGRRLFSAGPGVPPLCHDDIIRAKFLLKGLSKGDFNHYVVRSLKVKLMSFPQDTIVTLTALIEIMSDMGLVDYFEGHLEGDTKIVKTVVSKILMSDDKDIQKRGLTLIITLAKAFPEKGITVVAQTITDALIENQEKTIEGLCLGLEHTADYLLELKTNNEGMMSWEILAKKTVLPALEKLDNEITETALSKWKVIAGSTLNKINTPGAIASSESDKQKTNNRFTLEDSAVIIACHDKDAESVIQNKKADFLNVKTFKREAASGTETDSLEKGELDIHHKDDSFKDGGDSSSPIDRGNFTDNPHVPNGDLAIALQIDDDEDTEENKPTLPEAEKYDPTKISTMKKKCGRFQILLTIFVIIIVTIVVTVTIILTKKSDNVETVRITTTTPIPTLPPTSLSEVSMKQKLATISNTNTTIFDDSGKPYNKAYEWMLSDNISLDALTTNPNDDVLRERFALAHFYFSLTRDSNWTLCSHYYFGMPLENGDEEIKCRFNPPLETKGEAFATKPYSTRWLSNTDVCLWGGVYCHNGEKLFDSFIGSIEMFKNNLQGTISEQIGLLHSLNILLLTDNKISGSIPTEFKTFTDFISFRANGNDLRDDLENFYQFSPMAYLDLSNNQFFGTISTEIGRLRQMRYLFLANNELTGTIPTEIGELSRLDYFSTEQNPKLHGTLPTEVGKMVKLNELRLENSGLNGTIPTEVGKLRGIETIILENNRFSGNIPDSIYELSSLKLLYLGKNNLNGTIAHIIGNLSSLEIIHVQSNKLTGQIPTEIGKLVELRFVLLHRNNLNGTMPTEICSKRSESSKFITLAADCRKMNNITEVECEEGCCNVCCDRDELCYNEY